MKKLMKRLEDLMMAAAFAEAGEHDTALEIMGVVRKRPAAEKELYAKTSTFLG